MNTTPEQVQQQLQWRYATKQFDPTKTIDDQTIAALLESLRMSPSSFGLQPWKFIVITNQELKEQLKPHSWNQSQITDCSHVIVHCTRTTVDVDYIDTYVQNIAKTRGVALESLAGYADLMKGNLSVRTADQIQAWAKNQVYITQGMLMMAAAELQVDTCPMEGFDPAKYDEILELTGTGYTSTLVTPLGYRSADDTYADLAKVRFSADEMIELR